MFITRGLSPRYVHDLLVRAHELLSHLADGATLEQLHQRLKIEGYNRHSSKDLESLLRYCPESFNSLHDDWQAVGEAVTEVNALGKNERAVGPRKIESPRGTVWHLDRDCEWLQEGKNKAAADGLQRYRVDEVDTSSRPPCRHCTRNVTYWP